MVRSPLTAGVILQATAYQLATAVINQVSNRYQQLAEELLNTVRKTESSLKRLKKNRAGEAEGGDGATAAAMSDSEKIGLQLQLDVQEYGRQISKYGIQPAQLQSYLSLVEAVGSSNSAATAPVALQELQQQ